MTLSLSQVCSDCSEHGPEACNGTSTPCLPVCARYGCGTELPRDTDDDLCEPCRWNSYADAAEDARADRYDTEGNR